MRATFLLVAALLLTQACTHPAVEQERDWWTPEPVEVTDADMARALETWRRYNMPEPPADAQVVTVMWRSSSKVNGTSSSARRCLAFQTEPLDDAGNAALFYGTDVFSAQTATIRAYRPERDGAREFEVFPAHRYPQCPIFRYSDDVAAGIHLWSRGFCETGRDLVSRNIRTNFTTTRDAVHQPECETLQDALGAIVWGYWFNESFKPDTDRAAVHSRLALAVDEFSALQPADQWRQGAFTKLLATMKDSLKPSTAEPGSLKAMIDSLTEVSIDISNREIWWESAQHGGDPIPAVLSELMLAGFEAVPILLDHLSDTRLTRSTTTPMFNGSTAPLTVGMFAEALLSNLAGEPLRVVYGVDNGLLFSREFYEWWNEASQRTEHEYYVDLLANPRSQYFLSAALGDETAARILGHKYPESLGNLYLKAVEVDERQARALHAGIANGKLPTSEKVRLLMAGARSQSSSVRSGALGTMLELDKEQTVAELIRQFRELDPALEHESPWTSDAVQYAQLVQLADNEALWQALEEFTRRAEPGLRIHILGRTYRWDDKTRTRHALKFVAAFLDDPDECHRRDMGSGRQFAEGWGSITVGDFASLHLGELLKLSPEPKPEWTQRHWRHHKRQVRAALKEE